MLYFLVTYVVPYNLKSSLDRFIEKEFLKNKNFDENLKSSLDRFIVSFRSFVMKEIPNLKSSLDRFIEGISYYN